VADVAGGQTHSDTHRRPMTSMGEQRPGLGYSAMSARILPGTNEDTSFGVGTGSSGASQSLPYPARSSRVRSLMIP
jgi:hypothetical protein